MTTSPNRHQRRAEAKQKKIGSGPVAEIVRKAFAEQDDLVNNMDPIYLVSLMFDSIGRVKYRQPVGEPTYVLSEEDLFELSVATRASARLFALNTALQKTAGAKVPEVATVSA